MVRKKALKTDSFDLSKVHLPQLSSSRIEIANLETMRNSPLAFLISDTRGYL